LKNFLLLIVLIAAIGNGENGHNVEDEKKKDDFEITAKPCSASGVQ
jgi:hypothetical protein